MSYDQTEDRIDSKELLVISEQKPEPASGEQKYSKSGYKLRVVQWLFDGKGKKKGTVQQSTSLERREFYITEDGDVRIGKAKGLTLIDMVDIQKNWKEIIAILKNPPAAAWPEGKEAPAKKEPTPEETESLEEVPF